MKVTQKIFLMDNLFIKFFFFSDLLIEFGFLIEIIYHIVINVTLQIS